jgi:hypothetical protein
VKLVTQLYVRKAETQQVEAVDLML